MNGTGLQTEERVISLIKLLQMLSKRVTMTLITFRRKVKINATENATVPTPFLRSGALPLGRSHFQLLLLAEVPLGTRVDQALPLHRSAIGP